MLRTLSCAVFLSTFFVLLTTNSVTTTSGEVTPSPIEEIKAKYAFGSIYLTYIPINDMINLLNDEQKFKSLSMKPPPGEKILTMFRAFLEKNREKNMSDAVAFLQLDLNFGKAGYKKLADKDGVIRAVAWTKDEVEAIAIFVDK